MFRVIQETKPSWIVGENVANFVNMELERTLLDLESEGYETQTLIIPACGVNAKHKRDRVFVVAHTYSNRSNTKEKCRNEPQRTKEVQERLNAQHKSTNISGSLCDTNSESKLQANKELITIGEERDAREGFTWEYRGKASQNYWETNKSPICGVDDGVSVELDRLRSLGNAVVPQQIYPIFEYIAEIESMV